MKMWYNKHYKVMTAKEEQLFRDRLKKLEALRKIGIDPYPSGCGRTYSIAEILEKFASLKRTKKRVTLAGRIRAIRLHGPLVFGNLEDASGNLQFLLRQENLNQKFSQFVDLIDTGDFLEVSGILTETKRGEKTLKLSNFKILAKSLRALPDKHHGIADIETRLRKRYLDMIMNHEVRDLFQKKAKFWKALREYLEKKGFMEIDTPTLEDVPGGADATPFVTHHKALDRDFYLRISLELPLKKIIIGGFEKVYEIGKIFRNEGISTEHLQDYLECEFYWAYADYQDLMVLVEDLYKHIVRQVTGSWVTEFRGEKISWGKRWPKLDYFELVEKESGIRLADFDSDEKIRGLAKKMGLEVPNEWGKGRIIDYIFKKKIRPKLIQPAFLINHPTEVSPLAKSNPKLPGRVERVQVLAAGTEIGNGWSELNDPLEQKERFDEQTLLRARGDDEAQMMDQSFVEALEYGMPPTAGFGLSERLFAVLVNRSMRETVVFPPMKEERSE